MKENEKSQPADEELTPAQELSVALIRMADALLLLAKCVCQGDGSLDTLGNHGEAPDASSNNLTLNIEHSTLTPAPVSKVDLRSFLMTKDKDAVRKLFTEFSVTKFSEIPEDRYPEVMTKAQDLPDKEAA